MDLSTVWFILGSITTAIQLLTPVPTFRHIYRVSAVDEYSFLPYPTSLVSYALWLLYVLPAVHPADPPQSRLVTVALDVCGVIIISVYVIVFIRFSPYDQIPMLIAGVVFGFVAVGVIYVVALLGIHDGDLRLRFVGTACFIASFISSFSPLPVIVTVITTGSVEFLPFLPTLLGFSNGLIWSLHKLSHTPYDLFSLGAYTVAAGCGLAQMVVYTIIYNAADHNEEAAADHNEEAAADHNEEAAADHNAEAAADHNAEAAAEPNAEAAAEPNAEAAAEPAAEPNAEAAAEPNAEADAEPDQEANLEPNLELNPAGGGAVIINVG